MRALDLMLPVLAAVSAMHYGTISNDAGSICISILIAGYLISNRTR